MSCQIVTNKIKNIVIVGLGAIALLFFLIFGMFIVLNIGRYIGTIARYAASGNICFF